MYFTTSSRHDVRPRVNQGSRAFALEDALDVLIPPSYRTTASHHDDPASCSFVTIEYGHEESGEVGVGYVRMTRSPLYALHRSELLDHSATNATAMTHQGAAAAAGSSSSAVAPLSSSPGTISGAPATSGGGGYDTNRQGTTSESAGLLRLLHTSNATGGLKGNDAMGNTTNNNTTNNTTTGGVGGHTEGMADAGQSTQTLTSAAMTSTATGAMMTRENIKNGLMAALARSPGAETELGSANEDAAANHDNSNNGVNATHMDDEEMRRRVVGQQCNASGLGSAGALARLGLYVLTRRPEPGRMRAECITAIDLSHTQLGLVGPDVLHDRSNTSNDIDSESLTQYVRLQGRFYPDESLERQRSSTKVRQLVAQRSLALYLVAPLLFVPGYPLYRIRALSCTHCALSDADAYGLALILSVKPSRHHVCLLETLDLAYNSITAVGANYLKKALKFNTTLTTLSLAHNAGLANEAKLLEAIHKRLQRNAQGKSNVAWYHRRKKWLS